LKICKGYLLHVVIFFINIGPYHLSRLKAAYESCHAHGWVLTAVQATDSALEHPWGKAEEKLPFRLVTLKASGNIRHDPKWGPLINDREVHQCLDGLSPDVVFLPGWSFPVARAGISWCRRHGVPTVLMSESKCDDEPRRWWKEKVKAWFYVRKFNAALVGGKLHQEYAVALGLPADKVFIGYDAVDNDYFINAADATRKDPDRIRQQRSSIPSRNFFLCVMRFLPRKNVPRLVAAYASYLGAVGPELAWDLVLCGSGVEEKRIFEIIQCAGLERNVHMPGFLPYGEIADWYGMAGAFIHPALKEQWGLVINEACSAGLPILSSRTVGAAHELVRDGVNGYLFDPEDTGDMAKCMIRLHQLDEESRHRMGYESRKIVSDYSPRRFADGFSKAVKATQKLATAAYDKSNHTGDLI